MEKLYQIAGWLEEDLERSGWVGKQITLKWKLDTFRGLKSQLQRILLLTIIISAHEGEEYESVYLKERRSI